MKKMISNGVVTTILVLILAVRPVPVFAEETPSTNRTDSVEDAYQQMELLTEVLLQVKKNYVEERTYEELIHGALAGLLSSLDPHSSFMEPDEYEDLMDDTAGQYGGIGIHIGVRDGMLTVIAPIEDTPAFRAGLQSGDKIVEIDGVSTVGISMREAINKLRGAKGEKVTLSILSSGEADQRNVDIVRDVIEVASVKGARILQDGIAYARLTQFAEPTGDLLQEALNRLRGEGMKALVLDLRGNPGGLLTQAIRVAGLFLKDGTPVVSTKGRSDTEQGMKYKASGTAHYPDVPLVVLINGGSASASEIVAGAIQDHRRGVLIGQTSFGKGSVQSVIRSRTDGKSGIRLTTAYYYTPAGRLIHKIGIVPDITVDVDREEWTRVQIRRAQQETPGAFKDEDMKAFADAVDVPLQRAIDLLKALLIINGQGNL